MRTLLWVVVVAVVNLGCPAPGPSDGGTGGGFPLGGGVGAGGGTGGGATGGGTGGATGGATGGGTGGATGGGTGGATGGGTGGGAQSATLTFETFAFYNPALAASADGALHLIFNLNNSPSNLQYARCVGDCGVGSNWVTTTIGQADFIGSPRLVVGSDNRVHVLYDATTNRVDALNYATCAANCAQPASWTTTNLASLVGGGWVSPGRGAPLAIDSQNRLSFTVDRKIYTNGGLTLVTCGAGCTNVASWQSGTIRATGTRTALAARGTTLHQLVDNAGTSGGGNRLAYRTCSSDCTQAANWQELPDIFVYDGAMPLSIAVTAQGGVRLAYNQGVSASTEPANIKAQDNRLLIWSCDSNCLQQASWSGLIAGAARDGEDGINLAEFGGALVLSLSNGDRVIARVCEQGCLQEANWQAADLDTSQAMAAQYNPFTAASTACGGASPTTASWVLSQGVVAVRPDGAAALVHTASILRTCPGSTSVGYLPGYGRLVYLP